MANTTTTAESHYFPAEPLPGLRAGRRISWAAIFGGAIAALAVQIVLGLLGLGIGLSTVNPATEARPVGAGLGVGAIIWWTFSSLIAMFLGGWVAGRLAGNRMRFDRMLHGLLAWALVTLATFYLLTTAIGGIVSGATGIVSQSLGAAQQAFPGIGTEAQRALGAAQNLTPEQRAQVEQQAREAAQTATRSVSTASLVTAVLLLLSAAAAGWGGSLAPAAAWALATEEEKRGTEPPRTA